MTSASSVRSSSPSKGSASAVSNETAGGAIAEKMKSQDGSASNGTLPGTSKTHNSYSALSNSEEVQKEHQEKLQALKQRKFDLEKLLGEKNLLLEQIQRHEQQIIAGDYEFDNGFHKTSSLNVRKKISTTSFKLPSIGKGMYATKERSGSVGDMEKKIRQEMLNSQSLKPSNIDIMLLKPKRCMTYNDYQPSLSVPQQQFIPKRPVYHDLDCINIIAQPISIDAPTANYQNPAKSHDPSLVDDQKFSCMKSLSHSPVASSSNQSQRCSPVSAGGTASIGKCVDRVSSNLSSSYSLSDRRNSIKSIQQMKSSPKQQRQDDRFSVIVNSNSLRDCTNGALTMPLTRSDVDISSTMAANFSYEYEVPKLQINAATKVYRNDVADGVPSSHLSSANCRQSIGSGNLSSYFNVNSKMENLDPSSTMQVMQQPQYVQTNFDEALMSQQFLTGATTSSRQPIHILMNPTHERQYYSGVPGVFEGQPHVMGLGGYWKTLGKERVWCRFDASYDSSSMQANNSKPKRPNANMRSTPIKSLSLGNFDVINDSEIRDEMMEKISISSMNSEGNKKQKEKQWLETSLDGPSINTTKYLQRPAQTVHHLPSGHQNIHVSANYTTSPLSNIGQQVLTAHITHATNRVKQGSQSISGIANTQQDDGQMLRNGSARAKKATGYSVEYQENTPPLQNFYSRAASSASDSVSLKTAQDAFPVVGATAIPHRKSPSLMSVNQKHTPAINQPTHQLQAVKGPQSQGPTTHYFSSSPPSQLQPVFTNTNPRSPINAATLPHHDLIRIESPKNMTVVQQAIFMPYKEVTKPFEMSDFYKYSTKFRQKDKQIQQPPPPPQQQIPRHEHSQNNHQSFHQKQVEVEQ